jgi:hypothetical protein
VCGCEVGWYHGPDTARPLTGAAVFVCPGKRWVSWLLSPGDSRGPNPLVYRTCFIHSFTIDTLQALGVRGVGR